MKQKDGNREIKRNKHGKESVWIVKEAKKTEKGVYKYTNYVGCIFARSVLP